MRANAAVFCFTLIAVVAEQLKTGREIVFDQPTI
jgi:hypothetical protein